MSQGVGQNWQHMNTTDIEETRQNRGDGQAEPSTFGETQNGHWSSSGAILLDELAEIFRRYVVLPEWAPETLALWTIHTYAFELRDVTREA